MARGEALEAVDRALQPVVIGFREDPRNLRRCGAIADPAALQAFLQPRHQIGKAGGGLDDGCGFWFRRGDCRLRSVQPERRRWRSDRRGRLAELSGELAALNGLAAGSWDAAVVDELGFGPSDLAVDKVRFDAFLWTSLDPLLRGLGVTHLQVCGVVTNICVRSTVHDAFFLGYDVVVVSDAVAATGAREQESSLWDIETHFGIVRDHHQVLRLLAGEGPGPGAAGG